jgi:hypothetical protein
MKIIIIIPSSGIYLKTHDLKLRIAAKFQANVKSLMTGLYITQSLHGAVVTHR